MHRSAATTSQTRQISIQEPMEFEPMEMDEPGPSTRTIIEDPLEADYEQEEERRAPRLSQAKRELRERMESLTSDVEKDYMEWERQILHSACITLLTPVAIKA